MTSHGIQSRYLKAVERRKTVEMIEEYCLVHPENFKNIGMIPLCAQNSAKCLHDVYISGENVNISGENAPYSKVEYKKVKKSNRRSTAQEETTSTEIPFKKKDFFEKCQELLGGRIPRIKAILVPYLGIMEEALVMRAVLKAARAKKPSWMYACNILDKWKNEGILTLEDQDNEQRRFEEKKCPEKKVQEFSDIYVPRASAEEREGSDEE